MIIVELVCGLVLGYVAGSFLESFLHEHVSDAPKHRVRQWRRFPGLYRVLIETHFSHHVIHHFQTFKKDHVTQFASPEERAALEKALAARGQHGQDIIAGNFATRLRGEGGIVFALPSICTGTLIGLVAPVWLGVGAALTLALPPLFSHVIHPYLHMRFEDGQRLAPPMLAWLLRTRYMRAVYRNHFIHHRYKGTSNYNLVLGADLLRRRTRKLTASDLQAMRDVGMPLPSSGASADRFC